MEQQAGSCADLLAMFFLQVSAMMDHTPASVQSVLLWGPVLVKIILIIFTETELIKLFVQLILWCLSTLRIIFTYFTYYFSLLCSLELILPVSDFSIPSINYFFPVHEFLSKSHTTLRAECNPITP